jgi:hypothetical protein
MVKTALLCNGGWWRFASERGRLGVTPSSFHFPASSPSSFPSPVVLRPSLDLLHKREHFPKVSSSVHFAKFCCQSAARFSVLAATVGTIMGKKGRKYGPPPESATVLAGLKTLYRDQLKPLEEKFMFRGTSQVSRRLGGSLLVRAKLLFLHSVLSPSGAALVCIRELSGRYAW